MGVKPVHDGNPTRSSMSQACFARTPWDVKNALVLSTFTLVELDLLYSDLMVVADETSWPACLFLLKILMKQIIKLEKQEDSQIMTSEASLHLMTFTGDNDDFRFHHYFDLICGAREGGLAAVMLGHLRLSLEEMDTRFIDCTGSAHPQILEQSISPRGLSSQIHAALHLDEMEPKKLKLSPRSPQDARQQNASQLLSVPGMCQTVVLGACERTSSRVFVLRSYRRPEAVEPVSLVDVCQITMANSRYRQPFDARFKTQIPVEHKIGAVNNINYARLIADEVQALYNRTERLQCLLEIGSEAKKTPSSWRSRSCWPFNKTQPVRKYLGAKNTMAFKDSEHFQTGSLKELADYVTNKSMAEAEAYCLTQGLYDKLESCARVLVESRRSRASTFEWEIFAFSDRYMCSVCRKEGHEVDILDKPAFLDHVDYVHDFYNLEPPEMFKIQKESREEL